MASKKTTANSFVVTLNGSQQYHCKLCRADLSGDTAVRQHLAGSSHAKRMSNQYGAIRNTSMVPQRSSSPSPSDISVASSASHPPRLARTPLPSTLPLTAVQPEAKSPASPMQFDRFVKALTLPGDTEEVFSCELCRIEIKGINAFQALGEHVQTQAHTKARATALHGKTFVM